MKVLVTGGSGFLGAHCVDELLKRGYDVVTTVRSELKGSQILKRYPNLLSDRISYVVVKDMASPGAFDLAVQSDPPFEAVLHTASPFHYNVIDSKRDMLDPAINGTVGILRSIKLNAPSVRRVVITSSFAAMQSVDSHPKIYSEDSWNPTTWEECIYDKSYAYRGSKTFAEKAAYEFVENEKPQFSISTICPALIFGPLIHHIDNLDAVNTSNKRILEMVQGRMKEKLAPTIRYVWVDVRDVALAHIRAIETQEAIGKRFFLAAGHFSNGAIARAIKKNFSSLDSRLPSELDDDIPKDIYDIDNSRSKEILGITYRSLEASIVDTVESLQALGA